jgi:hypothetical protein
MTAEELAGLTNADAPSLRRLLFSSRASASLSKTPLENSGTSAE